MNSQTIVIFIVLLSEFFLVNYQTIAGHFSKFSDNHTPDVTILRPHDESTHKWNTLVRYKIHVSDKEDGDSKYREIASDEVFLKVIYKSKLPNVIDDSIPVTTEDPAGLNAIKISNCLNCHAFKSSLIGPSFAQISNRYKHTRSRNQSLEKHIKEGSAGVWGQASMPSHPELSETEIKDMVQWIMEYAADKRVNYYRGTEGTFRMERPGGEKGQGGFVLVASYTDHGEPNHPDQIQRGYDSVMIYGN